MQIPNISARAEPARPETTVLVTGIGASSVEEYASHLFGPPTITASDIATTFAYLQQYNSSQSIATGLDLGLFSALGLVVGTNTTLDFGGYYFESAFTEPTMAIMVENGSCATLDLASGQSVSLLDYLTRVVINSGLNLSSPGGLAGLAGFLSGPLAQQFSNITVQCTGNVNSRVANATAINSILYCGYYNARCVNGKAVINEYANAVNYGNSDAANMNLSIWYNGTVSAIRRGGGGPRPLDRTVQFFSRAINSWIAKNIGTGHSAEVFGVASMPKAASSLKLDFSSLLGPLFYCWVVQMLLPFYTQQFVYEKEKRLRMMMKMHGLSDGAYWLITYSWCLFVYILYIIIFLVFGSAIGLKMFTLNSYGIQIILYLLFGINMIALAFLLSCLFSSSRTAIVATFIYVFATGLIGNLLLAEFLESGKTFVVWIEIIPAFALYRGLWELASYSFLGNYRGTQGMQFSNLSDDGNGMTDVWILLVVTWLVFLVLALYLEQVFASGTGIRKHPLYFLDYIGLHRRSKSVSDKGKAHAVEVHAGEGEHADVTAERERVEQLTDLSSTPIVVRDLRKIYPGRGGGGKKVAVRNLTMAVDRGECFGLLGPNGAGKSTSINMMTGFLEPSHGSAIISGYDIRKDMDKIYSLMGVCPQHDLQWETLTGKEHLLFYGRLKGLKGAELREAVEVGLKRVNLWNNGVADKQSRRYSGGMRRRLSVAISFIGKPDVVYLDEPSTGLDPASRRNLWDVVKTNRRERAIILTTHSMEEAEQLCDRLGIFVDGQLVCIGNPKEITARYGGYLVFTLTVHPEDEKAAMAMVSGLSPSSRLTYSIAGTLKYELPTSEVSLAQVFNAMNAAKRDIRVMDWGVANATLEEVFIKFARTIGAGSADDQ